VISTQAGAGNRLGERLAGGSGGLSRPTSTEQVADYIRRLIFENVLRAGERIPQDEIASRLGVSRVPVREAVIALDREGWITNQAHRGAFVNGLDEKTVHDHYEFLGMTYGLAARRAAESGSVAGVAVLTEISREFQAATDPEELWRLNSAFLRQLLHMAGSRRITAMARILSYNVVPGKYFEEVPGATRIHKKGLRVLLRAIKSADGQAAQAEYLEIVRQDAVAVVALLKSRGYFAG
jgi:DNA-binding GntR family transcriptional regulator